MAIPFSNCKLEWLCSNVSNIMRFKGFLDVRASFGFFLNQILDSDTAPSQAMPASQHERNMNIVLSGHSPPEAHLLGHD